MSSREHFAAQIWQCASFTVHHARPTDRQEQASVETLGYEEGKLASLGLRFGFSATLRSPHLFYPVASFLEV